MIHNVQLCKTEGLLFPERPPTSQQPRSSGQRPPSHHHPRALWPWSGTHQEAGSFRTEYRPHKDCSAPENQERCQVEAADSGRRDGERLLEAPVHVTGPRNRRLHGEEDRRRREGDTGSHLYVSADGEYEVIKGGKILGRFEAGKAFGELAVLYNCKRTASIKALTNAEIWMLE